MQQACWRAQTYFRVYFYRVLGISSYHWSFEILTFMWAFCRASTLLFVQCINNFWQKKLKFTKVCFVSKVFFDMNHNRILWFNIQPKILIMNINILEIWIFKLFYFVCRWLSIREKVHLVQDMTMESFTMKENGMWFCDWHIFVNLWQPCTHVYDSYD